MSMRIGHICKLRFIIIPVLIMCYGFAAAQKWEVPEAKRSKVSSFLFNERIVKDGQVIYSKYCQQCHGNPGQNNGIKSVTPAPPDPASDKMQKNSDGDLFYKISEGREMMPTFKSILSEEERWQVIAYFRRFNKSYVQPEVNKLKVELSNKVRIHLSFNPAVNVLTILAKAADGNDSILLQDAEVSLFVRRYFGNMLIDSLRRTGRDGTAAFRFPKDLPADSAGMVDIVVKLDDENYGEITMDKKLKAGIPTNIPGLTENRAIWNVVSKAPWWLLITYITVLVGIWALLFYILAGLLKIRKLGKTIQN